MDGRGCIYLRGVRLPLLRILFLAYLCIFFCSSLFQLRWPRGWRIYKEIFFWIGIGDDRKIHLVNWPKICSPVKNGGLGIRCLRRFNFALLAKWLWRYSLENDALWRRVKVWE